MLLLNRFLHASSNSASAEVHISEYSPFFEAEHGVPAWIALEYMGQTAALIAGHQLIEGLVEPHVGFLLGTRMFTAHCEYFELDSQLLICCNEKATVSEGLATFDCVVKKVNSDGCEGEILAEANLSVFRRLQEKKEQI